MAELLGPEVEAFSAAMAGERVRGLRLNPVKIDPTRLAQAIRSPDADATSAAGAPLLAPIPWCPTGFSFDHGPLGGHPAHLAGLFYLQEPSAMLAAEALGPRPGWRVADLAAAPGGKTTHLAGLVGPDGCVVANELSASRLGGLHASLDLWGGRVVTTSQPLRRLAGAVEPFDGVILDAPCTGEGLFRRRPAAVRDWSPAAVAGSARRQAQLLDDAAALLRPGGVLVYSTCTFNREENEDRVAAFLDDHPEWTLDPIEADATSPGIGGVGRRIWPHRTVGEGQYVARLRAPEDWQPAPRSAPRPPGTASELGADAPVRSAWADFQHRQLATELDGDLVVRGDTVYLAPPRTGVPGGIAARAGLPLGRARPGRFEPAPALATSLRAGEARQRVQWDDDDGPLWTYLTGNVVEDGGPDGWVLVCWRDWPIGWARRSGGVLKNHLPEHVRRMVTPR